MPYRIQFSGAAVMYSVAFLKTDSTKTLTPSPCPTRKKFSGTSMRTYNYTVHRYTVLQQPTPFTDSNKPQTLE
jgi:hypothetical protein